MFKKYYKRLEFSIRKADYDDLMVILRRANTSLSKLTTQSISLENRHNSCKLYATPAPRFNAIHERAQGFYSALCSSWKCHCHVDHSVSLRLEPRIDDVQSDDDDIDEDEESMRNPFHVIFRYSHDSSMKGCGSSNLANPWAWEEADVRITIESQLDATNSSAVAPSAKCRPKVRFVSQAKDAVRAALQPIANLQPIQDLCAAISTLQTSQRDACLSLLAHEYAKQKFGILIYPSKERPADIDTWSTSTLRSILEDPGFSRRDRLRLAVTLSSSVLQLHETAWLDDDWGKEDIFFIKRAGKTYYQQPFVSRSTSKGTQRSSTIAPSSLRIIIRNHTLYALGVSLIELWYGKELSQLHRTEDGPVGEALSEFNTAYRLVDELYNEAGGKYSDAVRRCIRYDFDCRTNSLEDLGFQRAVYEGVVAQLKENFDFLY
jgi:hypothetical protein